MRVFKIFSPAYNNRKFHDKFAGISHEFWHDLARLYCRPHNQSAGHWMHDSIERLNQYYDALLNKKPTYPMFEDLLDKNSSDKKLKWNLERINSRVLNVIHEPYGTVENSDQDKFNQLILIMFYSIQSMNNVPQLYPYDKAIKTMLDWFAMVPNYNRDIYDHYNNKLINNP